MDVSKVKIQEGLPVNFSIENLEVSGWGEILDWNTALNSVRVAAKAPQEAVYILGIEHLVCKRTERPLCYVTDSQKSWLVGLLTSAVVLYSFGDHIFEVVNITLSPAKVLGAFLALASAGLTTKVVLRFLRDARRRERFWRFEQEGLAIEIGGGEDGYFVLTNTKSATPIEALPSGEDEASND